MSPRLNLSPHLQQGRNNVFHAIVVLLWHVWKRHNGMLDEFADVSLDTYGLNMLRILSWR